MMGSASLVQNVTNRKKTNLRKKFKHESPRIAETGGRVCCIYTDLPIRYGQTG